MDQTVYADADAVCTQATVVEQKYQHYKSLLPTPSIFCGLIDRQYVFSIGRTEDTVKHHHFIADTNGNLFSLQSQKSSSVPKIKLEVIAGKVQWTQGDEVIVESLLLQAKHIYTKHDYLHFTSGLLVQAMGKAVEFNNTLALSHNSRAVSVVNTLDEIYELEYRAFPVPSYCRYLTHTDVNADMIYLYVPYLIDGSVHYVYHGVSTPIPFIQE